ncbi:MAG TPA: ligase-associated DNA damage response DEXH box helicase [Chitinophagaceae bacterium]|nr:ligase-associated DNA damage response DEXH box helicase [Chitinophagaceae bacterium]
MAGLKESKGYMIIKEMMAAQDRQPFLFQEKTWEHIINGDSGLVNAPTGCGKTYSVFLGAIIDFINHYPDNYKKIKNSGLQLLWITPLRALATDIGRAMEEVITALGMNWKVGIRNGDTSTTERARQKKQMPEVLIITPESLHLLIGQKGYAEIFSSLKIIAVDEWHELLGSKRGVQVELAVARIVNSQKDRKSEKQEEKEQTVKKSDLLSDFPTPDFRSLLSVWGISATIGNLNEASEVLLSSLKKKGVMVKAEMKKQIEVESIFPDEIEKYPWAGHLGIKLIHKVLPIIHESRTTLIFINTRGMSEIWYQQILNASPDLAGAIALHHGSVERELREWVEENLHTGKLKAVVCTASLDLGVDFRPVETVIQVGSPKGVARFLQRAGRSGHQPDAISKIYFLPTHSLELIEAAALKSAIKEELIESRVPMLLCFDVLMQWLCTLAISDGFVADEIFEEIRSTYCYREITLDEWQQILHNLTSGGNALQQYDEYKKVEVIDGVYRVTSRRIAMRHRLHIGTIVSEPMMKVQLLHGGFIGVIEEWFISRLTPGEVFSLAGRKLEYVSSKDMTAYVRKSNAKKSIVPSWQGGRMPLSANLGKKLRETLNLVSGELSVVSEHKTHHSPFTTLNKAEELTILQPLFELQQELSHLPKANELLIEQIETDEGHHLFVYPFEGRLVHEAMAAILAYRISRITPITFSFAMNDYGFELLSDQPIPLDDANVYELFSPENLFEDIQRSVNSTEMAKRKFRDIATIGGLIFQGMPGERKKARHLQASASLLFNVFNEYEPHNLLLRQAFNEVFAQQMEEIRLRDMLNRIQRSKIILTFPERYTPFCFPIKVDSMREDLSSEKLEDRIRKMQAELGARY